MDSNQLFRRCAYALALSAAAVALPLFAHAEDAEGCTDHPLFNRLPNYRISECKRVEFDLRRFPVGPAIDVKTQLVDVEGPAYWIRYELPEDGVKPGALRVMRNFQNAARKAGASVEGEYPGRCQAELDGTLHRGNGCIDFGTTLKFVVGGKETWVFVESEANDGEIYELWITEREEMKQDIVANELRDKLDKDGFVALYINFDTGQATIQDDSMPQLDQVAAMLKAAPALRLEIAGHTDNVGTPESNQKLSDARAKSVVAVLVARGVAANRLAAKGHGQMSPVADNRTEEGRAKNRRVELVKL
jgi:OmpA-OmpF porin, OOP family